MHTASGGSVPAAAESVLVVPDGAHMRSLGERLARLLRPGDLLVLSGGLGAGKTTLTQGIGVGLGVRGAVTSPTFVIARVHPSQVGGPSLVHVDAYRLGGGTDLVSEVDDLDLDASLEESVTVVEWGEGRVEDLAEDRLEVRIERAHGGDAADAPPDESTAGDPRLVRLRGVGDRWAGADLAVLDPR